MHALAGALDAGTVMHRPVGLLSRCGGQHLGQPAAHLGRRGTVSASDDLQRRVGQPECEERDHGPILRDLTVAPARVGALGPAFSGPRDARFPQSVARAFPCGPSAVAGRVSSKRRYFRRRFPVGSALKWVAPLSRAFSTTGNSTRRIRRR